MDDKENEGSLLENFQNPESAAPEASPDTGISVPDLSFTMPITPDGAPAPELPVIEQPEQPEAPSTPFETVNEALAEAPLEGEMVADPVESVNQMLGEAVVAEESTLPPSTVEAPATDSANFALVIYGPVGSDLWQKALQSPFAKELQLPPEAPKARFHISRLTEYQAIAAATQFRDLGLTVEPKPGGAFLPETTETVSEGAAQVALPKYAKDVFLYSGEQPSGYNVQKLDGIVSTHRSIARRFFRDCEAQELLERELEKLHKPSKIRKLFPASAMERLFGGIFLDLQKAALGRGANGVVALRVEAFPESTSIDPDLEQIRLVALGTAAVVEKMEL